MPVRARRVADREIHPHKATGEVPVETGQMQSNTGSPKRRFSTGRNDTIPMSGITERKYS
jgi:hypothetical protein